YHYGILPTVPVLIRIADFFKVSIEYLLGNTENDFIDLSPSPASFQARLEYLRLRKGIASVYELAKISHIHRNNIAQWLKKDYLPAVDDLLVLANIFEVSCDFLVGRTDEEAVSSSQLIPPPYRHIG
ncbi:MAG: helix-turn-helix domain-containing protein, partial [Clostridiales bacterium]|nr:helix-turn-helix domain-containing protein [Clostridiales bacterium]